MKQTRNRTAPLNEVPARLHILGPFHLDLSGRHLRFGNSKDRALAAYLIVNRQAPIRRTVLADLLWGTASEKTARHSLSQSLYSLRRLLPEAVFASRDAVQWRMPITTDLDELYRVDSDEDLLRALQASRGPLLEDLALLDAPGFAAWRDAESAKLQRFLTARLPAAMTALPPGLRARYQATLPDAMTAALPADAGPTGDVREQVADYNPNAPFIGRQVELAALQAGLETARQGAPCFMLLSGQAGFGKTRLIEEFTAGARRFEVTVLSVMCFEPERRVGYSTLRAILNTDMVRNAAHALAPAWRDALESFMGWNADTSLALGVHESTARLFEACCQLLRHMTTRSTLVITIDDVQWLDRSTTALLAYLSHRMDVGRLLVIASLRNRRAGHKLARRLAGWQPLGLTEFTKDDLADCKAWLRQRGAADAGRLLISAGGHPYIVAAIMQNANVQDSKVVASVATYVSRLLHDLPASAQVLLAALAVLRRPAPLSLLRIVSKRREIGQTLDYLVECGLLVNDGGRVRFKHDILREAAYRRIPRYTRTELHRRAGDALTRSANRHGETAEHYYKAGEHRAAYQHALQAAREAEARNAIEEQVYFLKIAARIRPSRAKAIRLRLFDALYRAHRYREAHALAARLLERDGPSLQDRAKLTVLMLEMEYDLRMPEPATIRQRAEAIPPELLQDPATRLVALRVCGRAAFIEGNDLELGRTANQLEALALQQQGSPAELDALTYAARLTASLESALRAAAAGETLWPRVMALPDSELRIRLLSNLAAIPYHAGRLERSVELHDFVLREIERLGAINAWGITAANASMVLGECGRFDAAQDLARKIQALDSQRLPNYQRAFSTANHAILLFEMARYEECLKAWASDRETTSPNPLTTGTLAVYGLAALAAGRASAAFGAADQIISRLQRYNAQLHDHSYAETLIARVYACRGSRPEAIRRLQNVIAQYGDREVVCCWRLRCELAAQLKHVDRVAARSVARQVFSEASAGGARPIAERADALLLRL